MPSISVIIVTFNNEGTIKSCIDSINSKNPGREIIVVDNNSSDKTAVLANSFKDVRVIAAGGNLGFSKAVNLGVREASGEYLAILNPDARLMTKNGLDILVDNLESDPEYGLIAPRFINPDGSLQGPVRNFPTIINAIYEYIFNMKGSYDFYLPKCQELCQVETIYGACMVIKKNFYQKVKGLDEKFFMYYEEIDLCRKIKDAGLKVGFNPTVEVIHKVGHSGKGGVTSRYLVESSKKYHGLLEFYIIQFIIRISRYVHL